MGLVCLIGASRCFFGERLLKHLATSWSADIKSSISRQISLLCSTVNLIWRSSSSISRSKFKLTSLLDNRSVIYDNLIDAAEYLISNGYTKGSMRNVRMKLSLSLRGKKVNNGYNGSVRKTCYKHTFEIIN